MKAWSFNANYHTMFAEETLAATRASYRIIILPT